MVMWSAGLSHNRPGFLRLVEEIRWRAVSEQVADGIDPRKLSKFDRGRIDLPYPSWRRQLQLSFLFGLLTLSAYPRTIGSCHLALSVICLSPSIYAALNERIASLRSPKGFFQMKRSSPFRSRRLRFSNRTGLAYRPSLM